MIATTIAAAIFAALAAGAAGAHGYTNDQINRHNKDYKKWLREAYPDLTETQIDAIIAQYGDNYDDGLGRWFTTNAGDKEAMQNLIAEIEKAHADLGDIPLALSAEQIQELENNAYADIDAENRQIMDLYDQTLNRSNEALQQNLLENNAAFSDYRNQILSNDAITQQAIAGSTRAELNRQQRNAITRGASAAQRLVANINTQLGTQAQAAQQSLNTSNALAQQLLAHRQAQTGIRQDYTSALNQYDMNKANQLSGQSERRLNYAQGKIGWEMDKNQYSRDSWNDRVSNYFRGNSLGEGIYRNRYGSSVNSNNKL